MSENIKYVETLTPEKRQSIIKNSVMSMANSVVGNPTELKKAFVKPIVNDDGTPCIADIIDEIAVAINEHLNSIFTQIAVSSTEIANIKVRYGRGIYVDLNEKNYVLSIGLLNDLGNIIPNSTKIIDLPLESVVVGGQFDEETSEIVLTLKNGNEIRFPVSNIVGGFISDKEFDNFLATKGQPNGFAGLDENGKVPKEQLPAGSGSGSGGGDINLDEYVKSTAFKLPHGFYSDGEYIYIASATKSEIEAKTTSYKPISPYLLDYAFKVAAIDNKEEWTDEEKAAACKTLGAVKQSEVSAALVGGTIPKRFASGQILVGDPTTDNAATPKKWVETYVDDLIAELRVEIVQDVIENGKGEIVQAVLDSIGCPVWGLVDENNNIILSGKLADGTYTIKYEMEDGSTVDIGSLALDNNVYYTIKNNLTNCTTNNNTLQIVEGQSYSATITANDGYELKTVTVTMGGSSVTVTNGVINIASVTGDIVITAVATETASATNFADPTSSDWIADGRIRSNGQTITGAGDGAYASNYVSCQNGDIVLIKNASLDTFNHGFYDSSKTKVQCPNFAEAQSNSYITNVSSSGAEIQFTINVANTSYMRFSLTNVTDVNTVVINIKRNGEWL